MELGKLKTSLKAHEGERLKVYRDTEDLQTIGVGWCIDRNPLPVDIASHLQQHGSITQKMSDRLLEISIADAYVGVAQKLPYFKELGDVRQRVVVEMVFNIGLAGVMKFRNMLSALEQGHYQIAAEQMLQSKWAKQVKGRAVTMARMMATGKDA